MARRSGRIYSTEGRPGQHYAHSLRASEVPYTDLPIITKAEGLVSRPMRTCPGCGKHPTGGGGGPVWKAGLMIGVRVRNGCCGYEWFEPMDEPRRIAYLLPNCATRNHTACPGVFTVTADRWEHCTCACHQQAAEEAKARHPGVMPAARPSIGGTP